MSTRCFIAMMSKSGEVESVYCHWDGYPGYTGNILQEHYQDEMKIQSLLFHGDMSILGKNIDPDLSKEHSFKKPQKDVCVFYQREKHEEDVLSCKFSHLSDFVSMFNSSFCEYAYLYDCSYQQWFVLYRGEKDVIPLSILLASNQEEPPLREWVIANMAMAAMEAIFGDKLVALEKN